MQFVNGLVELCLRNKAGKLGHLDKSRLVSLSARWETGKIYWLLIWGKMFDGAYCMLLIIHVMTQRLKYLPETKAILAVHR